VTDVDEPACWSWELPGEPSADEVASPLFYLDSWRFFAFHASGVCALCGVRPVDGHLVEDHDHRTGMVRGLLCRGCNVREGKSNTAVLIRYRRIRPAQILGLYLPYTGIGWVNGWHVSEAPRDPWDVDRPVIPWKPWTRDMPLDRKLP